MLITPLVHPPSTLEELLPPGLAARLDRLDVFSRRVFAGKLPGERRSKRRGQSVEFDDFRMYAAGDDLRHVDWNIYARLDRLVLKLFREEEDLAVHVLVDASASMAAGGDEDGESKLLYAHRLAMAIAYVGLLKNNRVSVATVGTGEPRPRRLMPVRGRPSLARVASFLCGSLGDASRRVRESGGRMVDLGADLRFVTRSMSGRGILVVLSDLLAAQESATQGEESAQGRMLRALGAAAATMDVFCLQTLTPGELDPGRMSTLRGDLRLTDVETARGLEVTISPTSIGEARRRAREFVERTHAMCLTRGLAHFLVPTDTPIDRLMIDSLRRGGMLR